MAGEGRLLRRGGPLHGGRPEGVRREPATPTHEFEKLRKQVRPTAQPFTKESLLYREIFEKYYPGQAQMIADFWMPNKAWEGCDVNDPSARVLSNYGDSGK